MIETLNPKFCTKILACISVKLSKATEVSKLTRKRYFPLARGKTTQLAYKAEWADCFSAACTNTGSLSAQEVEWEERSESSLLTLSTSQSKRERISTHADRARDSALARPPDTVTGKGK